MQEAEAGVLILIAATIGGALGAKRAGSDMWRGATVILLSFLGAGALLYLSGVENLWLLGLVSVVAAGILGGALRLGPRQIAIVIIASLIMVFCAGGLMSLFRG